MESLSPLKYLLVLTVPLTVLISFHLEGLGAFLPILYAFALVPLLEFLFVEDGSNLSVENTQKALHNPIYNLLIRIMVPIQYLTLAYFLWIVHEHPFGIELIGHLLSMGLMNGVIGINVAHELGHRTTKLDVFLAKCNLLTSQYMHFYIDHNRGHHKHVSTFEDSSSARLNESLYAFWIRSVRGCWMNAWKLEVERLNRKKLPFYRNEMLQFQIIQALLLTVIIYFFSWQTALIYAQSAVIGFLLLETVNYIEHYGLQRRKVNAHRYEDPTAYHSWNSNHQIGRWLLFELSRHSDHHEFPHKPYQILESREAPQMPTGYPGMMLLSTIPVLWFKVMNKRIREMRSEP